MIELSIRRHRIRRLGRQGLEDTHPHAGSGPAIEAVIDRRIRAVTLRQIAPRRARAQHIEMPFKTRRSSPAPHRALVRQQRLNQPTIPHRSDRSAPQPPEPGSESLFDPSRNRFMSTEPRSTAPQSHPPASETQPSRACSAPSRFRGQFQRVVPSYWGFGCSRPQTLISSATDRSRRSGTRTWGWNEAGADLECGLGGLVWPPVAPTLGGDGKGDNYDSSVKQADEARKAGDFDFGDPALRPRPAGQAQRRRGQARPRPGLPDGRQRPMRPPPCSATCSRRRRAIKLRGAALPWR